MSGSKAEGADARLVPVVTGLAVMLHTMDAIASATALPAIANSLGVDPLTASLSITAYLIGVALVIPMGGWLDERFGGRGVFRLAIGLVMISSTASAIAPSLTILVATRFLNGLAAAVLLPVGRLMVIRCTPRQRLVEAMSTYAALALLGPMIGPIVGGLLVDVASWRAIYLINLPIGLVAFVAISRYATNLPRAERRGFDLPGASLAGGALAVLVIALELLGKQASPIIGSVLLVAGAAMIALLALHSSRRASPLIRTDLLRRHVFSIALVVDCMPRLLLAAAPLLIALLLQIGRGMSALAAGLVLVALPIGALTAQKLVPRLVHRFGFRPILMLGAGASGCFFASAALLAAQATIIPTFLALAAYGFTRSMVLVPTASLSMEEIAPGEMGAAISTMTVAQQAATALGVGASALLLRQIGGVHLDLASIQIVSVIMGLVTCLSLLALLRLRPQSGASMRKART